MKLYTIKLLMMSALMMLAMGVWGQVVLDLRKSTFDHDIKFENKVITKIIRDTIKWDGNPEETDTGIRFPKIIFQKKTDFLDARFSCNAEFSNTVFNSVANFLEVIFDSSSFFTDADFKKVAYFRSTNFQKVADFGYARFNNIADFIDANFSSDAYFSEAYFNNASYFTGSQFHNLTDYTNCTFQKRADFLSVKFDTDAYYENTHFCADANFSATTFNGGAFFPNITYDSLADFSFDLFTKDVVFNNSLFRFDAYFRKDSFIQFAGIAQTIFRKNVFFDSSYFNSIANFTFDSFQRATIFYNDTFKSVANFAYAKFNEDVVFSHSKFSNKVIFAYIYTTPTTNFYFDSTSLPDTIDFAYIPRLACEINLVNANFNDPARTDPKTKSYRPDKRYYIYLYNSDISKFHLDYFHFRLLLTDPLGHNLPVDEAKSIYEALLKNFKDRGQMDSYELLDIEYQDYKWNHNRYFSWFGSFLHHWNNYGHKNELPLLWTVCLIIIFTTITFLWLPFLHSDVYAINALAAFTNIKVALAYKYFFRRLWYSFIYTSLIFFPLSLKADKIKVDKKLGTLYVMLMYTVGLLCVGYVANFILQK